MANNIAFGPAIPPRMLIISVFSGARRKDGRGITGVVQSSPVDRERILRFVIAAFMLVMVAALIYEIFDIHDTKPFYTDPECLLMLHGSMLIFCIGIMALRQVFNFCFSLSELLPLGILGLWHCSIFHSETFEFERLLFSPPLSVTSLRI